MFPAEILSARLVAVAAAIKRPARARFRLRRIGRLFAALSILLAAQPAAADGVERLIDLLRLEEDIEAQYDQCIAGANRISEAEVEYEFAQNYPDIELQPDDLALLIAIYSEFYRSSCEHLAGDEVLNFYRAEFRRRFDTAEIDALVAFYETPLGVKLNAEWLEINRNYGAVLQDRQAVDSFAAQRRYEQRMEEFWLRLDEKAAATAPDRGASAPGPSTPCRDQDSGSDPACHDPA